MQPVEVLGAISRSLGLMSVIVIGSITGLFFRETVWRP
jgi:hypothetical protein